MPEKKTKKAAPAPATRRRIVEIGATAKTPSNGRNRSRLMTFSNTIDTPED